jgi:ABC-type uncharacterized transport system auxiliary subunit
MNSFQIHTKLMRRSARLVPLLLVIILSGCLPSSKVMPTRFYTLVPTLLPPAPENPGQPIEGSRIGLIDLDSADRIGSSILVRLPDNQVEHLEYDRWADEPAGMIGHLLFLGLQQSGRFEEVTEAKNVTLPGYYLGGILLAFEGVYPDESNPSGIAICRVMLELRHSGNRDLVWSKMIEANTEWNASASPKALVQALDQAAREVVQQAVEALTEEFSAHSR